MVLVLVLLLTVMVMDVAPQPGSFRAPPGFAAGQWVGTPLTMVGSQLWDDDDDDDDDDHVGDDDDDDI